MVDETIHEFGTFSLHQVGEHRFSIRNEGSVPLEVSPIATSCKCIASEIERPAIPPGESGDVVVYWKSGEVHEQFAQAVSVKTSDPELPIVQFKVIGRYLPVVAADPPELFLPRVMPHEAATAHTLIVSQRWEAFTVDHIDCSLEGAGIELQPASALQLDRLQAKSGYHLQVTLPSSLPQGPFSHWLRFSAVGPADAEGAPTTERLEMPLVGKVLHPISVYGKSIDGSGTIYFGTITAGTEHRQQLLLKVHDSEPDLKVTSVEVTPDFLDVSLEAYGDGSKPDLYTLKVTVPADAPERVYRGPDAGRIVLFFDHPRVQQLELAVDLVIAPAGRFANR